MANDRTDPKEDSWHAPRSWSVSNASYDGSTIVARNEDSPNGKFEPQKMMVVHPEDQPRTYTSVLSHLSFELPNNPMRYSSVPDVIQGHGVWAAAGFNEVNVGMSATETITSNERVLGADPLVEYVPAHGEPGDPDYTPEVPGGLSEEDFVTVVLPYIHSRPRGRSASGCAARAIRNLRDERHRIFRCR
ncbi:MAG: C69 family dipeptidase [Collinsella sp.]